MLAILASSVCDQAPSYLPNRPTGSWPETGFEETSGAVHPNGPFSAIRRLRLMCIGLAAKGYPDLTDDFTAMTTSVKSS